MNFRSCGDGRCCRSSKYVMRALCDHDSQLQATLPKRDTAPPARGRGKLGFTTPVLDNLGNLRFAMTGYRPEMRSSYKSEGVPCGPAHLYSRCVGARALLRSAGISMGHHPTFEGTERGKGASGSIRRARTDPLNIALTPIGLGWDMSSQVPDSWTTKSGFGYHQHHTSKFTT